MLDTLKGPVEVSFVLAAEFFALVRAVVARATASRPVVAVILEVEPFLFSFPLL